MPITINPRELRLLKESGMDWEVAKKITKMVKKVFVNSEIVDVTRTEPAPTKTQALRVFPIENKENDTVYITATKGGVPLKKKSNQNESS